MQVAASELHPTDPVRLQAVLLSTVFTYEIEQDTATAETGARTAFDLAIAELSEVDGERCEESVQILQILRGS